MIGLNDEEILLKFSFYLCFVVDFKSDLGTG